MKMFRGVIAPLLIGAALASGGGATAQKAPPTSTWVKDGTTPPGSTSLTFTAASPAASGTLTVTLAEGGNMTSGTWKAAGKIISVALTGKPAYGCTLGGLSAASFSLTGCTLAGKYTKQ